MTSSLRYAIAGTAVVAVAVLLFWPFLDPAGRRGVLLAALVALPVQIVSYTVLQRYKGRTKGFLAAWVGGTMLRMATIGVVAVIVLRTRPEGTVPLLFALASFFFCLLLLEPVYFRGAEGKTGTLGR